MIKLRFFIYVLLLHFSFVHCTVAEEHKFKEYQVKAVYLFNFAHFTTWPSEVFTTETSPINICIFGRDPFEDMLEKTIEGEKINGRTFVIEHPAKIEALDSCHILFIQKIRGTELTELLAYTSEKPILSISDDESFAKNGGIINFTLEDNSVRLAININAMRKANIEISYKVLQLAKIIE